MKTYIYNTLIDTDVDETLAYLDYDTMKNGREAYCLCVAKSDGRTLYFWVHEAREDKIVLVPDTSDQAVRAQFIGFGCNPEDADEVLASYTGRNEDGAKYLTVADEATEFLFKDVENKFIPAPGADMDPQTYNTLSVEEGLYMGRWLEADQAANDYDEDDQYWYLRDLGYDLIDDVATGVDVEARPDWVQFAVTPDNSERVVAFEAVPLEKYRDYFVGGDLRVVKRFVLAEGRDGSYKNSTLNQDLSLQYTTQELLEDDEAAPLRWGTELMEQSTITLRRVADDEWAADFTVEILKFGDILVGYAYEFAGYRRVSFTKAIYTNASGPNALAKLREAVASSALQFADKASGTLKLDNVGLVTRTKI